MDVVATDDTELGDSHGGDVLVVDAFNSGFDAARNLGVEGQAALPSLRHVEVLVHDGGRLRSGQIGGQVHVGIFSIGVDVLILHAVGVTHGGDDPHERQTASVEARTAADDVLTFASEVPIEAQTR